MYASSAAFINHYLHLASSGEDVRAHAALTLDAGGDRDAVEARGVRVHVLDMDRKSVDPLRVLGEARALRRIVKAVRPDIVVPIALRSVLVAAMATTGLPCGLAAVITGLGHLFAGGTIAQAVPRALTMTALAALLRGKRHVLVFSNVTERDVYLSRRVAVPERARVVPIPGVDTEVFAHTPEPVSGFRVVMPARMLWSKGVAEFVEAAAMTREKFPFAEFILAGRPDAGNPESIGVERLRSWTASGAVSWIGHCGDMPGLLSSCHAVCLPSYCEGFPRALVEAMACGRAVVATDMPGCRDALAGAAAGLLVPPRDAAALAGALERLCREPETRREMGGRGRRKVEAELSLGKITGDMLDIFERVHSEKKR